MSRNAIVYASRARSTGALALTIDTKHPDVKDGKVPFKGPMITPTMMSEFPELKVIELRKRTKDEAQMRYAAYDVDHKVTVYSDSHYDMGRAIAWPQEWCKKCEALHKEGKNIRPSRAKAEATNAKTSMKTPAKAAEATKQDGKRTSSKRDNNAKRRQQAANEKPGEVISRTPAEAAARLASPAPVAEPVDEQTPESEPVGASSES